MPMSLLVWSALAFATYSAYLGLAPWLRRRPVRITFPVHASVLAVALGPALTVWAFGWVRGTVVPTALAVFTVAFFVVAFAFTWITWRGVHEFHGATAAAGGVLGHMCDAGGWQALVGDVAIVRQRAAALWPGRPLVLLGHSMGSVLSLSALERDDAGYAAAVATPAPVRSVRTQ